MRAYAFLAALLAGRIAAHPLCFIDDKPTDYDEVLTFCPEPQAGACCTDLEEAEVEARYNAVSTVPLTGNCADLYKQVVCGVCHSYSAHLYEQLGAELGALDGMMMKSSFCEELVSECAGQITFPTYDGEDYCEKHTGGGDDFFWSYPYEEPEIFEPGLTEVFSISDDEKPAQTISVKQSPDSSMYFLVGQLGEVKVVYASDMGTAETVVDLDGALLEGGDFYEAYEEGLLDAAFGPMFGLGADFFYLSYTCELDDGLGVRNRLSKFEFFPGDPTATRNSEEILLTSSPRATSIHAAGWCGFKPSAYGNSGYQDLYWSTGDSGPQTDPDNNGQNTDNLLGSIIRISVPSEGTGYLIPSGNLDTGLPEICASGFRNPWRCSFDRVTEELYCGDVGHTDVEEIDIVECGNNYGWSRFEGSRCQEAVEDNEFNPPCDGVSRAGFVFPWFEYCHPDYDSSLASEQEFTNGVDICGERTLLGHSVIGGYVYRGTYFSDLLDGAYIFGDNTNSNVYFIKEEEDGTLMTGSIISDGSLGIIGFAEDNNGELMFIDENFDIYHMPCGDLCATTCLDQVENQPTYTSEGCFVDNQSDRALSIMAPDCGDGETAMSPAICASYCATIDGAIYAGVQYGYECFCGGAEASSGDQFYGRYGASDECIMLCTASPEELCGGSEAMEVFLLGAPEETEPPEDTPLLEEELEPVGTTEPMNVVTEPPVVVTEPPVVVTEPPVVVTEPPVVVTEPPVVVTEPPVVIEEPTDQSYLGCFEDSGSSRILGEDSTESDSMTAALCSAFCEGYPFYGTQYSEECWCGSNPDYDAVGAGLCNMPCTGDSSEVCGGFYSMSIYQNSGVVVTEDDPVEEAEPADTSYLGCYSDPRDGDRVMSSLIASTGDMTTEACATLCAGSAYFGTQYGTECWCGDASIDYEFHGEADCDYECSGDATQTCGGFDAISVYEAA